MLTIRNEQMEAMRAAGRLVFENEMVVHLDDFSPPLFKAVGEEQMRRAIRFGIDRAATHGFTFRGPVRLYLELMLLFGSHFDTDPQYPWAAGALGDGDTGPQMHRAELLHEGTMDYRRSVTGPEDAYTLQALRKISVMVKQPLSLSSQTFTADMLSEIASIYPQKAQYIGEDGLRALIRRGVHEARSREFATVRSVALMIVLMLAFGHGCADDPLYPWIARTLTNEAITDPAARATRLEARAVTWIEHVLGYFGPSESPS